MLETKIQIYSTVEEAMELYRRLTKVVDNLTAIQHIHDYAEENWKGQMGDVNERLNRTKNDFDHLIVEYVRGEKKEEEQEDLYI